MVCIFKNEVPNSPESLGKSGLVFTLFQNDNCVPRELLNHAPGTVKEKRCFNTVEPQIKHQRPRVCIERKITAPGIAEHFMLCRLLRRDVGQLS